MITPGNQVVPGCSSDKGSSTPNKAENVGYKQNCYNSWSPTTSTVKKDVCPTIIIRCICDSTCMRSDQYTTHTFSSNPWPCAIQARHQDIPVSLDDLLPVGRC